MLKGLFKYSKYRKIFLIILCVLLALIFIFFVPKSKKDFESISGQFNIFFGQYDKGISKLSQNPSHKNNFELVMKAKYNKGKKLYKQENYYESQVTFNEILDYRDSRIWYKDSIYQIGKIYYANSLYNDSLAYFSKIEDYSDAYVYLMLTRDALYNMEDFNNFIITPLQQLEILNVFSKIKEFDDIEKRLENNKYLLAKSNGTWEDLANKLTLNITIQEDGISLNHNLPLPANIKSTDQLMIKDNIIGLGTSPSDFKQFIKINSITDKEIKIHVFGNSTEYTLVKK
ncbi:MAG: hypothetical protein KFW09_05265 [Oscillospiraceae bacterium]|nr:hypothetical protein [Oscillospiraceae bacterium]